jgi:metal-dependent amidase/aminoacylase/carboxypeptidase family protein
MRKRCRPGANPRADVSSRLNDACGRTRTPPPHAGALEGVDAAFAFHVMPHLPSGTVQTRPGTIMAGEGSACVWACACRAPAGWRPGAAAACGVPSHDSHSARPPVPLVIDSARRCVVVPHHRPRESAAQRSAHALRTHGRPPPARQLPGSCRPAAHQLLASFRPPPAQGRGGHAAMPHLNVDPVVAAAGLVAALQVTRGQGGRWSWKEKAA